MGLKKVLQWLSWTKTHQQSDSPLTRWYVCLALSQTLPTSAVVEKQTNSGNRPSATASRRLGICPSFRFSANTRMEKSKELWMVEQFSESCMIFTSTTTSLLRQQKLFQLITHNISADIIHESLTAESFRRKLWNAGSTTCLLNFPHHSCQAIYLEEHFFCSSPAIEGMPVNNEGEGGDGLQLHKKRKRVFQPWSFISSVKTNWQLPFEKNVGEVGGN